MSEVYISCDVETNGPIPGDYSMLSLGAAAFSSDGAMLGTFSANLQTITTAEEHPGTMKFWLANKEAYNATRTDLQTPDDAMQKFVDWVVSFGGKPVCVCYPAGFDWTFLYWYLIHYLGESPFGFSCLDIKSYASAMMKTEYRKSTKKNMPKRWFSDDPHTHVAVEDAIEQGKLFCAILKENINGIE